ncbi:MAG TPA: hypothetical protein VGD98_20415 [Ktedonobacteraceae bacterium]
MQTSDQGFEQIMSAVLEQRQVWEKLQTENRELRQQLIDLRAGRGIYLEIANQRFELAWEPARANVQATDVSTTGKRSQTAKSAKVAPQPPAVASSGVLEEMLLDELSSAMTNRMGPVGGGERKSSTAFNEEQKANLRRDLAGSFLLE